MESCRKSEESVKDARWKQRETLLSSCQEWNLAENQKKVSKTHGETQLEIGLFQDLLFLDKLYGQVSQIARDALKLFFVNSFHYSIC